MQAIVLSGGFGTRLQSVVNDVPKPMAPIGDQPFLAIILKKLSKAGFSKIILSVGYKYEVIQKYFGNQFSGMEIEYVIEKEPLGTGGAVMYAISKITDEFVYVLNGDTYFDIDFSKMNSHEDVTIASKYIQNNSRYGSLSIDKGLIHGFIEKGQSKSGFINGGIYKFNVEFLKSQNFPKKFSLEKDFLERIVIEKPIESLASDGYFIDIGIPEDYFRFIKEYKHE